MEPKTLRIFDGQAFSVLMLKNKIEILELKLNYRINNLPFIIQIPRSINHSFFFKILSTFMVFSSVLPRLFSSLLFFFKIYNFFNENSSFKIGCKVNVTRGAREPKREREARLR